MSHRDSVTAAPTGARVTAGSPSTPIAAFEEPERGLYGVQFHPEVLHTAHGTEVLKNFLYGVADARRDLDARGRDRGAGRADPRPGRLGARDLRALRRRRLGGRRAARLQGDRRPADLRVRRPRPAAQGRGGAGGRDVRRPLPRAARPRRREGALPRAARGRHRPGGEAARHRRGVHPRLRGGGAAARRRRLPRAGHAVLGRDRVGRARRRQAARGDDQVAPQRRRPARGDGLRARRAAAAAVQGRGAPRRRGARPARAHGLAPAVPGPGPRDPDHRRGHRGAARHRCARPTRSSRTRSAAPASTATCGRASPCCPRSARSACRATSAPTRTRSSSARSRPRTR